MKIFVVGATGQIGKHLINLIQKSEQHTVRAMVRKQEQADELGQQGVDAAVASLEGSVQDIANAAKGCDAIVFTAGSGGHTGLDKTLLIDLDGAAKTAEAAEQAGITRFVLVSALQANKRENWNQEMVPYYVAKHYADKMVEQSSLDYTIIRPGGLLNEPSTGKVSASENLERGSIAREDVAKTIFASLNSQHTVKKSFDLISGETGIEEALENL
ncbi:SDR family oxidoreductase [Paenisporosarcina sp. TG-14]|uniref:SDR family oxidoreductase n=1 Tax=Paenisporosarcina sp. TG-14 TaxID=1231057 RepID=UPI0003095803|nr:SDR family oxidoreductase [Paenisporosarcina sp. TG-14]